MSCLPKQNSTDQKKSKCCCPATQTRYFLTSLTEIKDFAKSVRKHWSIENQLHWVLDISFREDSCGAKKDILLLT
jgi:predicted transposase YbfD/YdcC